MQLRWVASAASAAASAVAAAPLLFSATAHAQAPGEFAQPPPAYGPYEGPAVPPPPAPAPALPGRFSLGLNFQSASFSSGSGSGSGIGTGTDSVDFDGGTIAIRYRPWRKVELELTLGGGRQTIDGEEGDLAMGTGTLAVKYRFNQQDKWNWWLLAGFGATTIARHDASDDEIDAAQRPHVAAGIGVEYRFASFALQLEGRVMGLGHTEDEMTRLDNGEYVDDAPTGGTIALGASYYFGR